LRSLAHRGRQVEITSALDRRVSFDLLDFYHNESRLLGMDTRKRDATASAAVLEALTPFFEGGAFQAPVIDRVIPPSEGCSAYAQVARGEARRSRANVGENRLSSRLIKRKGAFRHEGDKTAKGCRRSVHNRDRSSVVGASFRPEPPRRTGAAES
jgi:hypothetical protein